MKIKIFVFLILLGAFVYFVEPSPKNTDAVSWTPPKEEINKPNVILNHYNTISSVTVSITGCSDFYVTSPSYCIINEK